MSQENLENYIKKIPKAELHCHIEGTLEPELMFQLAQRNKIKLPFADPDEVRKAYEFTDLQSFLNIYDQGSNVLCQVQDFYDLTWAYLNRVKADNVCHAEIFFDPQTHTKRGISFSTIVEGIDAALREGEKKLGITSKLILGILRDLTEEDALKTLEQAYYFKNKIVAVGLNSAEKGHPPLKFQRMFQAARVAGFLAVAHAGEEGPPDYIWQALKFIGVKRIDHGIRCIEDEELVEYLREKQIPLTVCPLSNVKLRVFNTIQDHNLKKLLDKGLCVTINSDDPAYFGGYINDNYLACYHALNLNKAQIKQLAKNSIIASFLEKDQKEEYLKRIESC